MLSHYRTNRKIKRDTRRLKLETKRSIYNLMAVATDKANPALTNATAALVDIWLRIK